MVKSRSSGLRNRLEAGKEGAGVPMVVGEKRVEKCEGGPGQGEAWVSSPGSTTEAGRHCWGLGASVSLLLTGPETLPSLPGCVRIK